MKKIIFCFSITFFLILSNINSQTIFTKDVSNSGPAFFVGSGTSFSPSLDKSFHFAVNLNFGVGYLFNDIALLKLEYQHVAFVDRSDESIIFEEIGNTGTIKIEAFKLDYLFKIPFIPGGFKRCGCLQFYGTVSPLSLYSFSQTKKINGSPVSDYKVSYGASAGIGFSFRAISNLRFYFESEYNHIFHDGTMKNYIPIKAGFVYFNY